MTFLSIHRRAAAICAIVLCVIAVVVLYNFDAATSTVYPPCPFYYLTGLHCPGCGSLRALHRILHFNFKDAFAMNPLAVVSLPFVAYGVLSRFLDALFGRGLPRFFLGARFIWTVAVIVVIYGVARNLPVYPFNMLAPGAMIRQDSSGPKI